MKENSYYKVPRTEMVPFIPNDAKYILEIGCGVATFGAYLKSKNSAEVWGVEPCIEIANEAKNKIDKVLMMTFDDAMNELPLNYFDCIIFNDVLEHLNHPEDALNKSKLLLKNNGVVVSSIPNVRHYGNLVRLLFLKDWKYVESGILDNTHLRFFTKKSIIRLYEECGFQVLKIKGLNGVFTLRWIIYFIYSLGVGYDSRYTQFGSVSRVKK